MRIFSPVNQRSRGFTLIELMISVGISGVLAATSVPSYKVYLDQTRLLAGELELTQALQSFSIQNEYSPPTGLLADLVSEGFIKVIPNDPWTSKSLVNTGAEEAGDWYYSNDGKTLTLYPYSHPNRKYELSSFGAAPLETPVVPEKTQAVAVKSDSSKSDSSKSDSSKPDSEEVQLVSVTSDSSTSDSSKSDSSKSDSSKSDSSKSDSSKSDSSKSDSSKSDSSKSDSSKSDSSKSDSSKSDSSKSDSSESDSSKSDSSKSDSSKSDSSKSDSSKSDSSKSDSSKSDSSKSDSSKSDSSKSDSSKSDSSKSDSSKSDSSKSDSSKSDSSKFDSKMAKKVRSMRQEQFPSLKADQIKYLTTEQMAGITSSWWFGQIPAATRDLLSQEQIQALSDRIVGPNAGKLAAKQISWLKPSQLGEVKGGYAIWNVLAKKSEVISQMSPAQLASIKNVWWLDQVIKRVGGNLSKEQVQGIAPQVIGPNAGKLTAKQISWLKPAQLSAVKGGDAIWHVLDKKPSLISKLSPAQMGSVKNAWWLGKVIKRSGKSLNQKQVQAISPQAIASNAGKLTAKQISWLKPSQLSAVKGSDALVKMLNKQPSMMSKVSASQIATINNPWWFNKLSSTGLQLMNKAQVDAIPANIYSNIKSKLSANQQSWR